MLQGHSNLENLHEVVACDYVQVHFIKLEYCFYWQLFREYF